MPVSSRALSPQCVGALNFPHRRILLGVVPRRLGGLLQITVRVLIGPLGSDAHQLRYTEAHGYDNEPEHDGNDGNFHDWPLSLVAGGESAHQAEDGGSGWVTGV